MNWAKMNNKPIVNGEREVPPCKDCRSRVLGCHSKCMKYLDWTLEREAYREAQLKKKIATSDVYDFMHPSNIRRRNDSCRNSKRRS